MVLSAPDYTACPDRDRIVPPIEKFRCGCAVTTARETRTNIFAHVLVQLRHHPVPV
jgi:hypothetical protein